MGRTHHLRIGKTNVNLYHIHRVSDWRRYTQVERKWTFLTGRFVYVCFLFSIIMPYASSAIHISDFFNNKKMRQFPFLIFFS